ncbi:hypothetical protein [Erythrobacter sp. THAF29]|uniref:hypothetical protein n=1 Tax=Erythrobacter sp. THAF29 TaxID=2587851 RepID=UPI0012691A88|nr:hypothetical protein [Erythrobacter sp. THAF29]QFT77783.1 hypothetical protein FIU90_09575 [Erythrobacter sp. THAF29]
MRTAIPSIAALTVFLAACSAGDAASEEESALTPTPEKHFLVNSLVDRFDVPACLDANLVGAVHRSEDDKNYFVRAFTAPPSCIEALSASFDTVGFTSTDDGKFAAQLYDGTTEKIRIELSDDRSVGAIEWEIERQ